MYPKAIYREVEFKGDASDPDHVDFGRLDHDYSHISLQATPAPPPGYIPLPGRISNDGVNWADNYMINVGIDGNYYGYSSVFNYSPIYYHVAFIRINLSQLKGIGYIGKLTLRLSMPSVY